jgi:hypothetical protein
MKQFVLAVLVLLAVIAVFEPTISFGQSQPNQEDQQSQGAHTPVWKKRYYKSRAKDGTEKWVQRGGATDLALKTRDPADPVPDSWAPPIIIGGGASSSSGSTSGGSSVSGGGCGGYSGAACNAYKAGEIWSADRLKNGTASGSEKAWYGR